MPALKYIVRIINVFKNLRPFKLSYMSGYAQITVMNMDRLVHRSIRMAVNPMEAVNFESLSTFVYASTLKPTGHNNTSLRMSAVAELNDRAATFSRGSRQIIITMKQMNTIIQSPVRVVLVLIIFFSPLPNAPLTKSFGKRIGSQQEEHTDNGLEQTDGSGQ